MTSLAKGYFYGSLGMLGFSLTLPATRIAVMDLNPWVVGLGRALVASVLAAVLLIATRQAFPSKDKFFSLALVALGVVIGFPVLTSLAMRHVDASHGAVVLGLLPLVTAYFGRLVSAERPTSGYWMAAAFGTVTVVGFLLFQAQGNLMMYDLMLVAGVILAAMGYAVGAKLSKEMGSWRVISWALVLSAPLLIVPVVIQVGDTGFNPGTSSLVGFLYVSFVSMFLAFFAWYAGLAVVGTAKIGLLQLLQPFVTIGASAYFLHEQVSSLTVAAAGLVMLAVFAGQRARVHHNNQN